MADVKSKEIESPCVGICQYNDEELCIGCFRTAQEISEWSISSDEKREKIMGELDTRMEKLF
tara:strand:+ start:636 stop:821 length:186 start_codon:yes stop_codon:yes gene_type:complete